MPVILTRLEQQRLFGSSADEGGATIPVVQTITVTDTQAPIFTVCPPNVEDEIIDGGCDMVSTNVGQPTVTDNCAIESLTYTLTGATTVNSAATGINYADGEAFNVGVTTVTYTATDVNGLSSTCTHTVWIKNLNVPQFAVTCPADVTVDADFYTCFATVNPPVPVISNPCNENFWVTNDWPSATDSMNINGVYPVGVTTIIWTITDASGNVTTCTQTITVNDLLPHLTVRQVLQYKLILMFLLKMQVKQFSNIC